MPRKLIQIGIAITPLLLTPLVFYTLTEGKLNLGGGEKDILWMIPWVVWGALFPASALVFMIRNRGILSWLGYSLAASLFIMAMLFTVTYVLSVSGII